MKFIVFLVVIASSTLSFAAATSRPSKAFLGVIVEDFSQDILQPKKGAVVLFVYPNSPASRAGVQTADVIVRWEDTLITGEDDIKKLLLGKPGSHGTIVVARRFDDAFKMDRIGVVLADEADYFIDIPKEMPLELRELIEEGELDRQRDIEFTDRYIEGARRQNNLARIQALREIRSELVNAKGKYLPNLIPANGSIGEIRADDGEEANGKVFQVIDKSHALVEVPNFGIVLFQVEDANSIADGGAVALPGLWKITGTKTYDTIAGTSNTVYVIEKFSVEKALEDSKSKPTDPEIPSPKIKGDHPSTFRA